MSDTDEDIDEALLSSLVGLVPDSDDETDDDSAVSAKVTPQTADDVDAEKAALQRQVEELKKQLTQLGQGGPPDSKKLTFKERMAQEAAQRSSAAVIPSTVRPTKPFKPSDKVPTKPKASAKRRKIPVKPRGDNPFLSNASSTCSHKQGKASDAASAEAKAAVEAAAPLKPWSSEALVPKQDEFTETVTGIRVENRLVGSIELKTKLSGGDVARLNNIHQQIRMDGSQKKAWTTWGVLSEISDPRDTKNGKKFVIIKLTDLAANSTTCKVFLFGKAYAALWNKIELGTLAFLASPEILPRNDAFTDGLALSISEPRQWLAIGKAKDFGFCKSLLKKGDRRGVPGRTNSNRRCTNAINITLGGACKYHLQEKYRQIKNSRMEVNRSRQAGPRPKTGNDISKGTFRVKGQVINTRPRTATKGRFDSNPAMKKLWESCASSSTRLQRAAEVAIRKRAHAPAASYQSVTQQMALLRASVGKKDKAGSSALVSNDFQANLQARMRAATKKMAIEDKHKEFERERAERKQRAKKKQLEAQAKLRGTSGSSSSSSRTGSGSGSSSSSSRSSGRPARPGSTSIPPTPSTSTTTPATTPTAPTKLRRLKKISNTSSKLSPSPSPRSKALANTTTSTKTSTKKSTPTTTTKKTPITAASLKRARETKERARESKGGSKGEAVAVRHAAHTGLGGSSRQLGSTGGASRHYADPETKTGKRVSLKSRRAQEQLLEVARKKRKTGKGPLIPRPDPNNPLGSATQRPCRESTGRRCRASAALATAMFTQTNNSGKSMVSAEVAASLKRAAIAAGRSAKKPNPNARAAAVQAAFGKLDENMKKKLMNAKSVNHDAALEAMNVQLQNEMGMFVKEEECLEALHEMRDLDVSAWHCNECSRDYEYRVPLCVKKGHNIHKVKRRKWFFQCDNCGERITTLNQRQIPLRKCRCENTQWIRTGMARVVKVKNVRDELKVEGDIFAEHSLRSY